MVAGLAVVDVVEPHLFIVEVRAQAAEHRSDQGGERDGAYDGYGDRQSHRLELFEDQRRADEIREVGAQILVGFRGCKNAGEYRAERAAYAMHAEGVERVIILEELLELGAGEKA